MIKKLNSVVAWFSNVGAKVNEHDGRIVKVGPVDYELTPIEEIGRERNRVAIEKARKYLVMRNKEMLTCPDFIPTPANATDIRATMRAYIDETISESKPLYAFLYQ